MRDVYPNKFVGKFKDSEVYTNPDVPEGMIYLMNPKDMDKIRLD